MSLQMRIEVSSGVEATEIPESRAKDLQEAYEALAKLPVNRMATADFPEEGETYGGPAKIDGKPVTEAYKAAWCARRFVRQGKAWAATQTGPNGRPLVFMRKGDVKGNPSRVSFRIYEMRETDSETSETSAETETENAA